MMDKLKMESVDNVQMNIEKIQKLFPNAVTEVKRNGKVTLAVDFAVLKQELSSELIDDKEERYQMTWPDKKKSILFANAPVNKTLRPCREESVDFDNTQNLYIEGDNLDVLKLLQETYLGKIKMIYIDPPYNTGNDFVYNDDFTIDSAEYIDKSGQYDEQGDRLVQNTESNGRFHTDWLNMIYPRLKVAKDLLTEDGVIFISINDNEQANLKKMCDEIFGDRQFITNFIWEKGKEGGNDSSIMRSHYDNVLCYCKDINISGIINLDSKDTTRHIREDKEKNLVAGIVAQQNIGELFQLINLSKQKDYTVHIPLIDGSVIEWPSYAPQKTIDKWIKDGKVFVGEKGVPYIKSYLKDELQGQKPSNIITQIYGTTKAGSIEMREFFGSREFFPYPKPSVLIKRLLSIGSKKDCIVLDFFSGSATTAHAVMQLNAEDGGNRKFIMVQLPEKCDEKSEAYKAGYKTICDIGKERIRRAGKRVQELIKEHGYDIEMIAKGPNHILSVNIGNTNKSVPVVGPYTVPNDVDEINAKKAKNLDVGFRVLKLDSSNMKDVYYKPSDYSQNLLDSFENNIKEDRTPLDLLFQVMLDLGKPLSAKIEEKEIAGKQVFIVDDNDLIACFDKDVTEETVTAIAKLKPLYAVLRDSGLSSDSVGANFDQIFATYSPNTTRKVL